MLLTINEHPWHSKHDVKMDACLVSACLPEHLDQYQDAEIFDHSFLYLDQLLLGIDFLQQVFFRWDFHLELQTQIADQVAFIHLAFDSQIEFIVIAVAFFISIIIAARELKLTSINTVTKLMLLHLAIVQPLELLMQQLKHELLIELIIDHHEFILTFAHIFITITAKLTLDRVFLPIVQMGVMVKQGNEVINQMASNQELQLAFLPSQDSQQYHQVLNAFDAFIADDTFKLN